MRAGQLSVGLQYVVWSFAAPLRPIVVRLVVVVVRHHVRCRLREASGTLPLRMASKFPALPDARNTRKMCATTLNRPSCDGGNRLARGVLPLRRCHTLPKGGSSSRISPKSMSRCACTALGMGIAQIGACLQWSCSLSAPPRFLGGGVAERILVGRLPAGLLLSTQSFRCAVEEHCSALKGGAPSTQAWETK